MSSVGDIGNCVVTVGFGRIGYEMYVLARSLNDQLGLGCTRKAMLHAESLQSPLSEVDCYDGFG